VFYEQKTDRVVMTAYINEHYHVIQAQGEQGFSFDGSTQQQDNKIQAAAQSPSGSLFTVVGVHGQVHRHDTDRNYGVQLASLGYTISGGPESMMAVSMPDDNTAHAFWMGNKGKMKFATIREGHKILKRSVDIDCSFLLEIP
jgi:hypothetical protein